MEALLTSMLALKLLHLLLFTYWLGADLGVFYASRFVADGNLSPAQRATAAKIMLGVDLVPRVCMPLTLASGLHLAALAGVLALPAAAIALVWLVCVAWLAMVLTLHHLAAHGGAPWLVRVDWAWRLLVIASLIALALAPGLAGLPPLQPWVAMKLLAFAGTVMCGLMIRRHLRPFGAAFATLMKEGGSARTDVAIATSIRRCVPFVWLIWALLVVCAALGLHLIG